MPTRKITRVYRPPGDNNAMKAGPTALQSEPTSLMDLLCALQQTDTALVPLAPQKALGILGRGYSGSIEQLQADVDTILAFKEGIPGKLERDDSNNSDWLSLVIEITILQHQPIFANPHIVDLTGISFYVPITEAEDKKAWPLLVSMKANLGDLVNFLTNEKHELNLRGEVRLQLFAELTEAVHLLHECNIAHGDLKPENILIESNDEGELNCKLTDFGSSTIRGLQRVPTSNEPWNAPEIGGSSQDLEFDDFAQADLFSFGLLALHLLVPLGTLERYGLCLIRRPKQHSDQWTQFMHEIRRAKLMPGNGSLVERALKVIESREILDDQRLLLRTVVAATINTPKGSRAMPWTVLLPHIKAYLSFSFEEDTRAPVKPPAVAHRFVESNHTEHSTLNLAMILEDLDDSDYVLRTTVARDILFKATKSSCSFCKKEYSLQYLVCRRLGFEAHQRTDSYRSGSPIEGDWTELQLSTATTVAISQYDFSFRVPEHVRKSLAMGIIVSNERVDDYQLSQRLPTATLSIMRTIERRTEEIGSGHICLARLKWELSLLLKAQSRLEEAKLSQETVVNILHTHFGDRAIPTLMARVVLANILSDQGSCGQAVEQYNDVLPSLQEVLGLDHPEIATTLLLKGMSYIGMGENHDAEPVLREVISLREKFLSPLHPLTIRAEVCLVTALRLQGKLAEALEQAQIIDNKLPDLFIRDEFVKAQVYITEAALCEELGHLEEANDQLAKAFKAIDHLQLPNNDSLRTAALMTKASMLKVEGKFETQEEVLRSIIDAIHSTSTDEETPILWDAHTRLAECLRLQRKYSAAEETARQVLSKSERSVIQDTENSLRCTDVIVYVLSKRGDTRGALELRYKFLKACKQCHGEASYATLQATQALAETLTEQSKLNEAIEYGEVALKHHRSAKSLDKNAIAVLRHLVFVYNKLGQLPQAEKYCLEMVSWAEDCFGASHEETTKSYRTLVRVYMNAGKRLEAENICRTKLGAHKIDCAATVAQHIDDDTPQ